MPMNLDHVLAVMETLTHAECAVEVLYKACASEWQEDREFWLHMASEEAKHGHNIEQMMAIVSSRPELFQAGRSFSIVAINAFIDGVRASIGRIEARDVTMLNMLCIARDIENSLIESKYSEIMKTKDREFLTLANEIDTDTLGHKRWINKKISDMQITR